MTYIKPVLASAGKVEDVVLGGKIDGLGDHPEPVTGRSFPTPDFGALGLD